MILDIFNTFGFCFMVVIMIPNIIFAVRHKDNIKNKHYSRALEIIEQIGRFGCFVFMIINLPGTWFGWRSDEAFALYLFVNCALVLLYCAAWIALKKENTFRALTLSILPSAIFLFSGIMSRSVSLIVSALIFAPAHILISYNNSK